jgi:flagella basal body P-ring formation protein FlgA
MWLLPMWVLPIWMAARILACQAVDGDRILGKDLAAADAAFAALDPELEMGAAPLAGVRRVVQTEELVRWARQHGVTISSALRPVCFERVTEALTADALLPALRQALAMDAAGIEILDYSRYGVPRGELEFTRAGLSPAGMWRGRVIYGEARSAPVWAKVRITAEQTWVEAAETLAAGQPVDASRLAVRKGPRFPFGVAPLDSPDLAAGKKPLRTIRAGEPIYASMLTTPREVERGDKIAVEVSSGGATLAFEAMAESSGRAGDSIVVRNPENGRLFQAKVDGKGKVSVKK